MKPGAVPIRYRFGISFTPLMARPCVILCVFVRRNVKERGGRIKYYMNIWRRECLQIITRAFPFNIFHLLYRFGGPAKTAILPIYNLSGRQKYSTTVYKRKVISSREIRLKRLQTQAL